MPFSRRGVFVRIVFLASCIATTGELAAQPKTPIPDAQAQQTAKKAAGELFAERFTQAKTTAEKTALATDMMDGASKVQAGSADQYVLLKIALDVAAGTGDAATALQAVERLLEQFDESAAELIGDTLLTAARQATTSAQHKAVAEAALSIAGKLSDADQYETALRLCEAARSSAQRAKLFPLAKELTAQIEETKRQQLLSEDYRKALSVLENKPTDPAANLAAGRHLCFVKGNWDRGVPMLALGSDAALKAAAIKDLRGANSADEQAAIGDAWWDVAEAKLGEERDTLRRRAGFWYRQAFGNLEGLARLKVQQRIDQLGVEMPKSKASEPMPVGEIYCFEGEDYGVFSPDGGRVLTSSRDNALRLWDVVTRREIRSFSGHTARPRLLCFVAPKGDRIISAGDDATIRVWDTETKREVSTVKVSTSPHRLRSPALVAPGGKRLLWCGEDKWVHITDLEAGKDFQLFDIHHGDVYVYVVAFSQDGQWALSGGFESTARFWNVATGKAVDFDPHTHMYGGGLSPDGRLALTAGGDQLVRLWNLPGRVELARYAGHSGHVYAAIFSPDGRRILSGDANGEVRLWDTKAASELHCYRGHTKPISRLAFSPDGRYALSSAEDGVRLLGLPP